MQIIHIMVTETTQFITPMQPWESIGTAAKPAARNNSEAVLFKDIFQNVVDQVYETHNDRDNKAYLLATGQLDDAHSLPIAEAKASLSLDVLISLRNKALESYNELIKISS